MVKNIIKILAFKELSGRERINRYMKQINMNTTVGAGERYEADGRPGSLALGVVWKGRWVGWWGVGMVVIMGGNRRSLCKLADHQCDGNGLRC